MGIFNFKRILGSPLLFVLLLAGTSAVAFLWYEAEAAQRAPAITGYDWTMHQNALLISYPPDDCGCGASVSELVEAGLKHDLDVLVIASSPSTEMDDVKRSFPEVRVIITTNVSLETIRRFSPRNKIAAVRIHQGRVIRQTQGSFLPESFFSLGGART